MDNFDLHNDDEALSKKDPVPGLSGFVLLLLIANFVMQLRQEFCQDLEAWSHCSSLRFLNQTFSRRCKVRVVKYTRESNPASLVVN